MYHNTGHIQSSVEPIHSPNMSTPRIKFENSPVESLADSFVSTPGTQYPSLFDTMDQSEMMSPDSFDDDSMFGGSIRGESMAPTSEKKPVKKRKSWGQQLPEPTTNLPPRYKLDNTFTIVDQSANPFTRKRAKTEAEKEQRRVERVLRNRRAAQSSRERKRQEVEKLDEEKHHLERMVRDMELQLADERARRLEVERELELERAANGKMNVFRGSSPVRSPAHAETLRQSPSPTFSQELFESRDSAGQHSLTSTYTIATSPSASVQTVNPAALSPEIRAVDEANADASSSDMTQHPAAMLCDLQCQSEEQRPWMASTSASTMSQIFSNILMSLLISSISSTLLNPLSQIFNSLRTGSSLSPTTSILTSIIWLTTTTASLTTSTSKTTSTTTKTTSPRPMLSLRIRLLNQLLACSPNLARPLLDATTEAMRLATEQQLTHDCLTGVGSIDDRLEGGDSPSIESLMTLAWCITMFQKRSDNEQVGQEREELYDEELFGYREMIAPRGFPCVSHTSGKKNLDEWRSDH